MPPNGCRASGPHSRPGWGLGFLHHPAQRSSLDKVWGHWGVGSQGCPWGRRILKPTNI